VARLADWSEFQALGNGSSSQIRHVNEGDSMPAGDQLTTKRTEGMKMPGHWRADNAEVHPGQRDGELMALAFAVELTERILKTATRHSRIVG
jgi:hypothetical protein